MQSKAELWGLRISTRKASQFLNEINGANLEQALGYLKVSRKKMARPVQKLVMSAYYNYRQAHGAANPADLLLKEIYATQGTSMRRYKAKAHGRAGPIVHRTSNVFVKITPQGV